MSKIKLLGDLGLVRPLFLIQKGVFYFALTWQEGPGSSLDSL